MRLKFSSFLFRVSKYTKKLDISNFTPNLFIKAQMILNKRHIVLVFHFALRIMKRFERVSAKRELKDH